MDLSQIEAGLQEAARPYGDRRVQVFDIHILALDANTLRLGGRVLDESTRTALAAEFGRRFPGLQVDMQAVEAVRNAGTRKMAVATNLTSVHDGTSFLAEQVTQMLNGVQVEVLWQQDRWGFVRQPDGYLGWTYLPYLTDQPVPEPTHLVTAPVGLLRAAPQHNAALVTRVMGGTAVSVREDASGWACLDLAGGWQGWLPAGDLRRLDQIPVTASQRRQQIVPDAFQLTGVPYLWGGCSAHGIDCSGLAQLLHRWIGLTIPRDADMQYDAGQPVEPPFAVGDLLFFGEKGEKRRITHVAISLGGWQVIHSSRSRNGVQVDDVQNVPHLRDSYLCAASYIGRP